MLSNISPISLGVLLFSFYIVVSWWIFRKKNAIPKDDFEDVLIDFIISPLYIFLFAYIISANIVIGMLGAIPIVILYMGMRLYERRKRKRAIKKRIK